MSIVPKYEYLLVAPSGDIKGFNNLEETKGCINMYYDSKVLDFTDDESDTPEEMINSVCQILGVHEGECKVYNNTDVIEKIQETLIFEEEKEEVINKLLGYNIDLNIYKYSLDEVFNDVEEINIMES